MNLQLENYSLLPLRDVVFKTIRKAILTGELMPGERLMELHLADQLGVSRTPIREAIRQLELEGLVVMIPRKGAHVAPMSEKGMLEVLEVRLALDELAVSLACERITEDEIVNLNQARIDFENAVFKKNHDSIASADVAFHDVIFQSTRNPRLGQLVTNLSEQMYRYRFEYIKNPDIHQSLIDEHEEIFDAIRNRDKCLAISSIHVHVENQAKSILKKLRNEV